MPAPEINVRLSADGVQDIVNAFRRVQQESRATKSEVSLLNEAMGQLTSILPAISIGAAVAGIVSLGKSALDSAVDVGKLSEKTGASAGTLSVLAMAAHDVGISQDQLGQAVTRLARQQELAATGNAKAKKAFSDLGISMDDVRKKNPADLLVEVAQHLQTNIPEGAQRSAVAMTLFQRGGQQIIPLLDEIGQADGFAQAEDKAKALGLYLSDDMVAEAKQAEEEMRTLQDVAQGVALQFVSGFIPQMSEAFGSFEKDVTGTGTTAFKTFGDFVGNVVRGIVNLFLVAGQTIAVVTESAIDGAINTAKTGYQTITQLAHGNFSGAWTTLKSGSSDTLNRQGAIWSAYGSEVYHEYADEPAAPPVTKTGGGTGGSGDGHSDAERQKKLAEFQKLVDARATYQDAVANAELQKQKVRDQLAESQDKDRYDAGLMSLEQYYDARAARINSESDAETAILQKKLDAQETAAAKLMGKTQGYVDDLVKQGPDAVIAAAGTNTQALAMLQKIAQTRAQIDDAELQRQQKVQQNDDQRHHAEQQTNAQILSDRQRLAQLEGNTAAAQQAALEKELQEMDQLLQKQGMADAQRAKVLADARVAGTARIQFGGYSAEGAAMMADLQDQTSTIQAKATAGAISELNAQEQIREAEEAQLAALQQIEQRMQQTLQTLDPATEAYQTLSKQMDQYKRQVDNLAVSLQTVKTFNVELSNQLLSQGIPAFVTFFDEFGSGSKSFTDALTNMGDTFEKVLEHMISQMIVYYTLLEITGLIANAFPGAGIASFYNQLSAAGPFGGLTGHAAGGYTGNVATNRVAGVVHGKEFVFTAAATKRWGLPLLEAMNAGAVTSVASPSGAASLGAASGAESGDSGSLVEVNVTNATGQSVSQTQRQGPGGQSIIDIVVGQVASDIASGGKVGQSIQSTFGVSRKGIRRG